MSAEHESPARKVCCPVCGAAGHDRLYPEYSGRCITSQLFFCDDIVLDNRCCAECGFIFNARGVRGIEDRIYNTMVWQPKPQVMSFAKGGARVTSHQNALNIIQSLVELPAQGRLLDFGAGTGAFLECFQQAYPAWHLAAIEPGNGYQGLCRRVRLGKSYNQPYYTVEDDARYDAVVVTSVLEHVADPVHALRWIRQRLAPGGRVLMQHPNFASLPGDLFCADHINKLTVPHTRALCRHAGFSVDAEDVSTLMFYFVLSACSSEEVPLAGCRDENLAIARQCEHVARRTVECVRAAAESARSRGGRAAVFGTSPVGSMAPLVLDCKADVACFVDENASVWGRDLEGISVVGPDRMRELGVTDVALAISPLYWRQVAKKMEHYGVAVHVPKVATA